jgi:hypothetical protein
MLRYHDPMETGEDTYTTAEAGRILRRSNRRILQMLESGELEGEKDESGRWRIPQRVVHELLPSRPPRKGTANGAFKARQEVLEVSESPVEIQLRIGGPLEGARALGGPPRAYGGCREHLEGELGARAGEGRRGARES